MLQQHRIDMSYCKFWVYLVSANTKFITLHIQVNIYYIESLLFTLDWSWTLDPYTEVTLLAVVLVRTFRTSRGAKILPLMTSGNCRQVVTVVEREVKCEYTSLIGKDHCYTYCIQNKHILMHCFCSNYLLSNKYLPK